MTAKAGRYIELYFEEKKRTKQLVSDGKPYRQTKENYFLETLVEELKEANSTQENALGRLQSDMQEARRSLGDITGVVTRVDTMYLYLDSLVQALAGVAAMAAFRETSREQRIRACLDYMYPVRSLDSRVNSLYGALYYEHAGLLRETAVVVPPHGPYAVPHAALRSPWLPPDVLVAFDPQAKRHIPVVRHHISTQSEIATRDVEEGTDVRRVSREVSTTPPGACNVDLQTDFRGKDALMQTEQRAKDSEQQTDPMPQPAPPEGGGMPSEGDVAEGKSGAQWQMAGKTSIPSKISPHGPPAKGGADSAATAPVGAASKPRKPFVKISPKGDPAALAKRIEETEKRRPGIRNWADRLMCRTSPNPSDTVLLSQLKAPPRQVKVLGKGTRKEEISMGALAAKMHIQKPALMKPALVKPALVKPALVKPAPVEPEQVKPEQVQPEQVKPAQAEPEHVKPALAEPEHVKPAQVKPAPVEPEQVKPALVKPTLVKPALVKPAQVPDDATPPATKKMSMTKKAAASKLPPKKLVLTKPGQKTPLILKKPKSKV